jgi:RHS repeat-associated protein
MWQDIRFEYDAWGNVATKRKGARQVQVFTFDAENRLLKVVTKNGRGEIETSFEYDALGRRIGKTEKTTEAWGTRSHQESVRFVWQGLRLVQEIDPDDVRSYVYSPDAAYTPLARVDVTNIDEVPADFRTLAMLRPRVLHFHTDQIGTPQEVTDKDGELLWSGQYDAWGKVRRDGTAPRIEQPLRFAGQYADAGTGLHYNTFRYYDPDVGRFISQDPIGLHGGINLYQYGISATRWIDPLGLAGVPVPYQPPPYPLPAFDGTTTEGVLVTNEGAVVPLKSGGADPRFANYVAASHVEGKAAVVIRETGSTGGTVWHNNPGGQCNYCNNMVETLLPENVKLTTVPPEGAVAPNRFWHAQPMEYTGNSKTPNFRSGC